MILGAGLLVGAVVIAFTVLRRTGPAPEPEHIAKEVPA